MFFSNLLSYTIFFNLTPQKQAKVVAVQDGGHGQSKHQPSSDVSLHLLPDANTPGNLEMDKKIKKGGEEMNNLLISWCW